MLSGFLVTQVIRGVLLSLLYAADAGTRFYCTMELTSDSLFR